MIQGTVPIQVPTDRAEFHVERAYWLTTKVETGATFGTVIAYDGTGMTAGPDQHIAVYPKELASEDFNPADDQGGLWHLLRRLEVAGDAPADYYHLIGELWRFFKESMGGYVAQDGVLRYLEAGSYMFDGSRDRSYNPGSPVFGHHIRASLTPTPGPNKGLGQVPSLGQAWEQSAHVAELFHKLMSHPSGFRIQTEFGKEHLVKRQAGRGAKAIASSYGFRNLTALRVDHDGWSEDLDLALSMYQSNGVNAPAIANQALDRVWAQHGRLTSGFARALVRELGNSTYGRWDDDIPSGRYQRTRSAAMGSGLWSKSLFEGSTAIMPKDL